MNASALFLPSAILFATALPSQQTVTLEPVQDTAIFSNSGTLTSGGGNLVSGATARFGVRRALLQFDLSSVPAGAVVTAVDFSMTMQQSNAGAINTNLHALFNSWGEGNVVSSGGAGAPAQPGDATWTDRFLGTSQWVTPGGDFDPVPVATLPVAGAARYTWTSTPAMVALVQSWADQPTTNFGWLVLTDESTTSAKLWNSREFAVAADRPNLVVSYSVPATVTNYGTSCGALGGAMTLGTNGLPVLGTPSFAFSVSGGPNSGVALLVFGTQSQVPSQPYQGCPVHIGGTLDFVGLALLSSNGSGSIPLAVPNLPGLLGATVFAQALGLGNGNQVTTSTALELRPGL